MWARRERGRVGGTQASVASRGVSAWLLPPLRESLWPPAEGLPLLGTTLPRAD